MERFGRKDCLVLVVVCSLLFLVPAGPAQAGVSAGLSVSTLGAGGEIAVGVNRYVGVRTGYNYFTYSYDGSTQDVDYDLDLTLSNTPLLLDIYPFGGIFRLTGGVLVNWNNIDAESKGATIKLDGQEFDVPSGTLKGDVDFNTLAPYLGLGWAFGGKAWQFHLDLGVVFQGSPDVDLRATGTGADDPAFRAAVEAEEKRLEDEVDGYEYYPVLTIGICYRF